MASARIRLVEQPDGQETQLPQHVLTLARYSLPPQWELPTPPADNPLEEDTATLG
ncbi:hypothetical protein Q0Z83_059130 [Actinoplanes sichuanensis]|nr:hypothetical protein Q0Z83_059130 [Actinoplanes sichuanensis]